MLFIVLGLLRLIVSAAPPLTLVADQFQFTKTHYDRIFKPGHEHPDKANGFEIRNISHLGLELINRNTEEVPCFRTGGIIGKVDIYHAFICNKILSHLHL